MPEYSILSSSQFEGLAGNPGMGRQYFESSFVSLVIACEVLVYLRHSITGHAHCDTVKPSKRNCRRLW